MREVGGREKPSEKKERDKRRTEMKKKKNKSTDKASPALCAHSTWTLANSLVEEKKERKRKGGVFSRFFSPTAVTEMWSEKEVKEKNRKTTLTREREKRRGLLQSLLLFFSRLLYPFLSASWDESISSFRAGKSTEEDRARLLSVIRKKKRTREKWLERHARCLEGEEGGVERIFLTSSEQEERKNNKKGEKTSLVFSPFLLNFIWMTGGRSIDGWVGECMQRRKENFSQESIDSSQSLGHPRHKNTSLPRSWSSSNIFFSLFLSISSSFLPPVVFLFFASFSPLLTEPTGFPRRKAILLLSSLLPRLLIIARHCCTDTHTLFSWFSQMSFPVSKPPLLHSKRPSVS